MKPIAIFVLYIEIYVGLRVVAETKCGNAKCSSVSLQQQGKSLGKFYNVLLFLRKYALYIGLRTTCWSDDSQDWMWFVKKYVL